MFFYILLIIMAILFIASVTQYQKNTTLKVQKALSANNVVIITVLIAFVVFAFLQKDVSDLIGYKNSYTTFATIGWEHLAIALKGKKEPIYYLITFLMAKFGIDYRLWRTLVAAFFSFGFYKLISKHSVNPFMSLMIAMALELYAFTLTGLRQSVAFSVLFFSYTFLKEKKFCKFALIVLLATCFHSTAIIFLAAYPVYHLNTRKRNIVFIFAIGCLMMFNARPIINLYMDVMGSDYNYYLEHGTTLNISGIIIYGAILAFCLIFGYKKEVENSRICHLLVVSFLFRVFATTFLAEMFRLSMYYSLFDGILLAEVCSHNEKHIQNSKIKTILVSLSLLLYFIISPAGNILIFEFR